MKWLIYLTINIYKIMQKNIFIKIFSVGRFNGKNVGSMYFQNGIIVCAASTEAQGFFLALTGTCQESE